ncbi:cell division suppressor protein YneA [Alteribacter keqinensis]|nr:LysM peptidoglycan-binding domain-containing protein [Alteribacter keqinensis]
MDLLINVKSSHVITAVIILVFVLVTTIPVDGKSLEAYEYDTIVVSEGDTLWTIASDLQHELNSNKETIVGWIADHNDIDGAIIIAGQKLTVPVKGENG